MRTFSKKVGVAPFRMRVRVFKKLGMIRFVKVNIVDGILE
jgi:hypothetical protein